MITPQHGARTGAALLPAGTGLHSPKRWEPSGKGRTIASRHYISGGGDPKRWKQPQLPQPMAV